MKEVDKIDWFVFTHQVVYKSQSSIRKQNPQACRYKNGAGEEDTHIVTTTSSFFLEYAVSLLAARLGYCIYRIHASEATAVPYVTLGFEIRS